MPGTASDRGLDDPFEPKSAIVHSAQPCLADLRQEFGNFGLAAAAYNGGRGAGAGVAGGEGPACPGRLRLMCCSSRERAAR